VIGNQHDALLFFPLSLCIYQSTNEKISSDTKHFLFKYMASTSRSSKVFSMIRTIFFIYNINILGLVFYHCILKLLKVTIFILRLYFKDSVDYN
jgi:hypothetical protein